MLHPDLIATLADGYRREAARRRASPRAAEVKARLERALAAARADLDALEELGPEEVALLGWTQQDVAAASAGHLRRIADHELTRTGKAV